MGREMANTVLEDERAIDDPDLKALLDEIASKLSKSGRTRTHRFEVNCLESDQPNAQVVELIRLLTPLDPTLTSDHHDRHLYAKRAHQAKLEKAGVDVGRVALAAFTYYPDKQTVEPGYTVEEDIEWAIEPLRILPGRKLDALRARVRLAIVDPSIDRQEFIRKISTLGRSN